MGVVEYQTQIQDQRPICSFKAFKKQTFKLLDIPTFNVKRNFVCNIAAQDRDRWWALVNAVMNLRIP